MKSSDLSIIIVSSFILGFCITAHSFAAEETPKNEVPMYGGIPRTPEEQKYDRDLVDHLVRLAGGNRDIAYQMPIDRGWDLFDQKDYKQSMRRFNQAWLVDPNKPAAFHGFGSVMLEWGKQDEFIKWNRIAAEKGYPNAQVNMGWAYMNSVGVKKDPVEGAKWYRKAVEQGQIKAQEIISKLYEHGIGVERNQALADKWKKIYVEELAKYEEKKKLKSLSGACVKYLLNKQPIEAFGCLKAVAEKGDPNSQNALGILCDWGYGAPKDGEKSAYWYEQADAQGFSGSWIGFRKKNYHTPDENVDIESLSFEDVIDQTKAN